MPRAKTRLRRQGLSGSSKRNAFKFAAAQSFIASSKFDGPGAGVEARLGVGIEACSDVGCEEAAVREELHVILGGLWILLFRPRVFFTIVFRTPSPWRGVAGAEALSQRSARVLHAPMVTGEIWLRKVSRKQDGAP